MDVVVVLLVVVVVVAIGVVVGSIDGICGGGGDERGTLEKERMMDRSISIVEERRTPTQGIIGEECTMRACRGSPVIHSVSDCKAEVLTGPADF